MAEEKSEFERLEIAVDWSASESTPGTYANQMLTQVTPDEVVLVFGQIFPPALVGGADVIRAHIEATGTVTVHPVAKVILSPARLYELIEVLGTTAEKLERAKKKRDELHATDGGDAE